MGRTKHPGPQKLPGKPDPKLWVSKVPFGLGKIKPTSYSRYDQGDGG